MKLHVEVNSKGKRGVYALPVNSLDTLWTWACPVCPFRCQDKDKRECQKLADEHQCDYGWCPVPMTPARVKLIGLPHIAEPTKADRARWAR